MRTKEEGLKSHICDNCNNSYDILTILDSKKGKWHQSLFRTFENGECCKNDVKEKHRRGKI